MMHHPLSKFLLITLSLIPALVFALPSDREQPINIEADHAQLDDQRGVTQYKGNAILTQGTLKITGDIITFYYDDQQQITKAIAEGNLATYQQIHKEGEDPVKSRALQMEYHAKIQKIYLLGQGYVLKEGNTITGNKLEYDIAKNVVNVSSSNVTVGDKVEKASERVHFIIQPPGSKKASKPVKKEVKKAAPTPVVKKDETSSEDIAAPKEEKRYPTGLVKTHLNLRTGPGTHYEKLGVFKPNSEVIVLTRQTEWFQVRGTIDSKPVIGWISRRYVELSE
jgi:lipopolysaccharide export system protein LptA